MTVYTNMFELIKKKRRNFPYSAIFVLISLRNVVTLLSSHVSTFSIRSSEILYNRTLRYTFFDIAICYAFKVKLRTIYDRRWLEMVHV